MTQSDQNTNAGHLSEECIKRIRQYTNAMVHLVDKSVGNVIEKLKEIGEYENTIIIFTSDHGDFLGDYGLLRKSGVCSEALVHVPFIIKVPGHQLPSSTNMPISSTDVLPTLCALTGIPVPEGIQGQNFLPVLQGTKKNFPLVYGYLQPKYNNFSIYDDHFRFTYYPITGERELYDHRSDPHELVNLSGSKATEEHERRLYQQLLELHCAYDVPSIGKISAW